MSSKIYSNLTNYKQTGVTSPSSSGSTTNNSSKYDNDEVFIKGSVVLLQHGLFGKEDTMVPLMTELKKHKEQNEFFKFMFNDGIIKYDSNKSYEQSSDFKSLITMLKQNPDKNVLIRTFFSNAYCGKVKDQAVELEHIIKSIRAQVPNIPIVLIGYSKGGLVNCRCAVNNEGLINRIINIATPHTTTIVHEIVEYFIKQHTIIGFEEMLIKVFNANRDYIFSKKSANAICNPIMDLFCTDSTLKDDWNKMKVRPKFSVIGSAAVQIGDFTGDVVVPVESAVAEGFLGRTNYSMLLNFVHYENKITFGALDPLENSLYLLKELVTLPLTTNPVEFANWYKDLLKKFIKKNFDLSKFTQSFKDWHTNLIFDLQNNEYILNNPETAMDVYGGLLDY